VSNSRSPNAGSTVFKLRWNRAGSKASIGGVKNASAYVTKWLLVRLEEYRPWRLQQTMKTKILLVAALLGTAALSAHAEVRFGFSITLPAPVVVSTPAVCATPVVATPVAVVQTVPPCPGVDYVWVPGYWSCYPNGRVWVSGGWHHRPVYVGYGRRGWHRW